MSYVSRRSAGQQAIISRFANKFLKPNEKRLLAQLLGKSVADLTFTAQEGMRLSSITDNATFTGKFSSGPNYSNFYDFILTMDQVLNHIRSLESQVQEMDNLNDIEAKGYLDKQILASDFRLWGFHDVPKRRTAPGSNDSSRGQVLGSKTYFKPVAGNVAGQGGTIEPKDENELSVDEAIILGFPILNHLTALGQGQFIVNIAKGTIGKWTGDGAAVLHKKYADPTYAPSLHKNPYTEKLALEVGATGPWLTVSNIGKVPKVLDRALPAFGTYLQDATAKDGSLVQKRTLVSTLKQHIYDKPEYSGSKDLAIAYKKSKAHEFMNKAYYNLQSLYTHKRARSSLGMGTNSGADIVNNRYRGVGLDTNLQCGPGSVPMFVGHDGNPVR